MISDRKKTLLLVALLILTPMFLTGALVGVNIGASSVPAVAGYNDAANVGMPRRAHHASNQLALRGDAAR